MSQLQQDRHARNTVKTTFNGFHRPSNECFKPKGGSAAMSHNAEQAFRQPIPMPACAHGRQTTSEEG